MTKQSNNDKQLHKHANISKLNKNVIAYCTYYPRNPFQRENASSKERIHPMAQHRHWHVLLLNYIRICIITSNYILVS